jgi:hypothetical protein
MLFASDAIHGAACPGVHGAPAMCPTYEEVDPYLATIALVEQLAPGEMHSGHWPRLAGAEVGRFLDESRSFVERVDGILLARLARAATMAELCDHVQREAGPWETGPQMLMFCVHGHLRRLQRSGRVVSPDPTAAPRLYTAA